MKGQARRDFRAADMLLRLLQCGAAQFYLPTGELRFDGLLYSASSGDWTRLVDVIGWDKVHAAIARAEGGAA
jgi:hypothetical protein